MSNVRPWLRAHKRPITKWTIVTVIVLLLGLPLFSGGGGPTPLDPKSTAPTGTKAFAMLMQQAGAEFSTGDAPTSGTAVLLEDTLTDDEASRVHDWVQNGGTLIVADARSSLADANAADPRPVQPQVLSPQCSAPYAKGVSKVRANTKADYLLFTHDDSAESSCFPYKGGYFVTVHADGSGHVIDIGSPDIFTNQDLGNYDNAVLLTNLVNPKPGDNIVWLQTAGITGGTPADSSSGGESISQLLPSRVKEAIWQLVIAGAVLVLWRARRLGQPVDEAQLVEIPASQLVVATGRLLEVAAQSSDAAAMMRADVKRSFSRLLGVDITVSDAVLVEVINQRTNIPKVRIEAVLFAAPAGDGLQLIALAQQLEYLYLEVSRVR